MIRIHPLALTLALLAGNAHCQEWTRFRGPNGSGVGSSPLPAEWRGFAWTTALPGPGHSSPVLWANRLFVTGSPPDGSRQELYCLDAKTGDLLWTKAFPGHSFRKHDFNSFASGTPAVDAQRVYVAWAVPESYRVAALNHAGELLWERDLGPYNTQHGGGTSPIVLGNHLILPNDQRGESFLIALDRRTGETIWKTPRPSGSASYATPCVFRGPDQRDLVICSSEAAGISALDPADGRMVWSLSTAFDKRTVSSPFVGGGLIFGACGSGGGGNYLVAIQPPSGPSEQPALRYTLRRSAPYVPTSLVRQDLLFTWSDAGIVSALELESGAVLWQERVGGRYFASPVLADDLLFCISDRGEVPVVKASRTFEVVARNTLPEGSHATPALANGRMYLRTFGSVFCVEGR